jgi:DHA3 family tetracycline resistance protein-like MFS transporter
MQRLSARTTWYVYEAAASFLGMLAFTVTAVYYVTEVGMSPLQLVLVGTLMEVAIFVFEVPTGVVADTYSRRLSIVIGTAVIGLAVILFGAFGDAVADHRGRRALGLRYTLRAAPSTLARGRGGTATPRRRLPARRAGRPHRSLAGIGASVGLAIIDLRLPILVAGARRDRARGSSLR